MRRPQIEKLLPEVFQRTLPVSPLLGALLEVMEVMHAPVEAGLEQLEQTFDPRRCPDAFVPLLARWVGLDLQVSSGLGRKRELVAGAVQLSQWRGTARGILGLLTAATGLSGFTLDENRDQDGHLRPFHLLITAPAESASHRDMLEALIAAEKPAYVTWELRFRDG
jgi:phage tail-like protein